MSVQNSPVDQQCVDASAPTQIQDWSEEVERAKRRLIKSATGHTRCTVRASDLETIMTQWGYDEMSAEICYLVREANKRVTGGTMTFAMDDVTVLECLATRAVEAGLVADLHPSVAKKALALHAGGAERVHAQADPQPVLNTKTDPGPSGGIK